MAEMSYQPTMKVNITLNSGIPEITITGQIENLKSDLELLIKDIDELGEKHLLWRVKEEIRRLWEAQP